MTGFDRWWWRAVTCVGGIGVMVAGLGFPLRGLLGLLLCGLVFGSCLMWSLLAEHPPVDVRRVLRTGLLAGVGLVAFTGLGVVLGGWAILLLLALAASAPVLRRAWFAAGPRGVLDPTRFFQHGGTPPSPDDGD
jgi:hypothetical protein